MTLRPFLLLLPIVVLSACGEREPVAAAELQPPSPALASTTLQMRGPPTTAVGFVDAVGIADLYATEAAQLALAKSRNPEVRRIAERVLADHTASTEALKLAALGAGVGTPTSLDDRRRGWILQLRDATGAAFDTAFLRQQTATAKEAAETYAAYLAGGAGDDTLIEYARKTAPMVDAHREALARAPASAAAVG